MKLNLVKSLTVLLLIVLFSRLSHSRKLKKRRTDVNNQLEILKNSTDDKIFLDNINNKKNLAKLQKYISNNLFNFGKYNFIILHI